MYICILQILIMFLVFCISKYIFAQIFIQLKITIPLLSCEEPTGFVIQCNHSVFVDFGHVMNDVLWIDAARVQDFTQGHNSQNPLQAETHETNSDFFFSN